MDLRQLKNSGPNWTAGQQAAFYHARKRRRARENANASEFKVTGDVVGVFMASMLRVGYFPALGVAMTVTLQAA